jgi:hypothetical protein
MTCEYLVGRDAEPIWQRTRVIEAGLEDMRVWLIQKLRTCGIHGSSFTSVGTMSIAVGRSAWGDF